MPERLFSNIYNLPSGLSLLLFEALTVYVDYTEYKGCIDPSANRYCNAFVLLKVRFMHMKRMTQNTQDEQR